MAKRMLKPGDQITWCYIRATVRVDQDGLMYFDYERGDRSCSWEHDAKINDQLTRDHTFSWGWKDAEVTV